MDARHWKIFGQKSYEDRERYLKEKYRLGNKGYYSCFASDLCTAFSLRHIYKRQGIWETNRNYIKLCIKELRETAKRNQVCETNNESTQITHKRRK